MRTLGQIFRPAALLSIVSFLLLSLDAFANDLVVPPVVFTTQPQEKSVALGETATFTISAVGVAPITYQWRFDSAPILGATNTQLVLTNVTDQDYGLYSVEATNPLGAAVSESARLIRPALVQILPAIEVVLQLEPYREYTLESSLDLATWTFVETLLVTDGALSRLYQARGQKLYYRARMHVPQAHISAPLTAAALQNSINAYTVRFAGETNVYTLNFPAAGEYILSQQGQTNRGAATQFIRQQNIWTFDLTPAEAGAQPSSVRMEFLNPSLGSFVILTEGQPPRVGRFLANADAQFIVGKTLRLTYTQSGERFDFLSDTAVSYEQGAVHGTYVYNKHALFISVTLSNGWAFEIDLSNPLSATVVFRETPGSPPDIQQATYTLQ